MHSMKTDPTLWMPRLIWVFAGHTGHFVGFVVLRLNWAIEPHHEKTCLNVMLTTKVQISLHICSSGQHLCCPLLGSIVSIFAKSEIPSVAEQISLVLHASPKSQGQVFSWHGSNEAAHSKTYKMTCTRQILRLARTSFGPLETNRAPS